MAPIDDSQRSTIPIIDIGPLFGADTEPIEAVAAQVDRACREVGFFGVTGHGIDPELQARLDAASRRFFDLPEAAKQSIAMANAGPAWRGWFPVEGELTSGAADLKEGIYFGVEHDPTHPRASSGTPLHGANVFPAEVPELRAAVLDWMAALRPVADAVMRAMAIGLGLPPTWFEEHLTGDPTILFRVFHYPAAPPTTDRAARWGVGEHTDYGLLTLLAQDHHGGLQVRTAEDRWVDVEPLPGVLVCNIGDMLDRLTGGVYRSTPHRVSNTSGASRLSFPYFFDPSWEATVPVLPTTGLRTATARWDGADVAAWEGTYGEYLTAKVALVFPDLFGSVGEAQ